MASVFDGNVLIPTSGELNALESQVFSLTTPHSIGAIDDIAFLQFPSSGQAASSSQALQPATEQVLVRADVQSTYTYGNLTVFINGAPPAQAGGQPNAFSLTVGQNRQTLIQGVNFTSKNNQTSLKQELWDDEVTTNNDQVKVSYFVATVSIQNHTTNRFTFGNESLVQWGDRFLTSWRSETMTTVGNTTSTVEGKTRAEIRGNSTTNNYAGVITEVLNGGTDLGVIVGLSSTYQEGLTWNITIGMQLLTHLYVGVIQALGMGANVMDSKIIGNQFTAAAATLKNVAVRLGANSLNSLVGALLGIPRV